jgi:hypothetical protein
VLKVEVSGAVPADVLLGSNNDAANLYGSLVGGGHAPLLLDTAASVKSPTTPSSNFVTNVLKYALM